MSSNIPFPIKITKNSDTVADSEKEKIKSKPFRCGACEQDFSAICLLHTHLRGGSYHYDKETMTAFPLSGTTCVSVFNRLKAEASATTPDSTRKIFKIKKIRKKGGKKRDSDDEEEWNAVKENEGYSIGEYEKAFNINPDIEMVNDEASPSTAEDGSTPKKKRQLVINLFGMERNEDGSLRLVVGEKDSAVFKTPAGDAILKALKTKGKIFKGHMKVVYNYPDSVGPAEDDGAGGEDLMSEDSEATPSKTKMDATLHTPKAGKINTRSSGGESAAKKLKLDGGSHEHSDTITIEPMSSPLDKQTSIVNPPVFQHAEERLTTMEAADFLNEAVSGDYQDKIAKKQILRPKGGEVYLMDLHALPKDVKVDTFKWNNCGSKKYPKGREVIMKTVYKVRLPNGYFSDVFVKHFYQLIEDHRYCLAHYIGDPPKL